MQCDGDDAHPRVGVTTRVDTVDSELRSGDEYRSALISGGHVLFRSVEKPARFPDHSLLVRPLIAGICRSDYKELDGTRAVRSDFGHEFVAVVENSSPGLPFDPGAVVGFNPHPDIVRNSGFGDLVFATGGSQELIDAFVPLPEPIQSEHAVFLDPLACVIHAVRRLPQMAPQERVLVLGAGTSGILFTHLLREREHILTLANRSLPRLEFAQAQGLHSDIGLALSGDVSSASFDLVVVATAFSTPEMLNEAERCVAPEGQVLIFGGTDPAQSSFFAGERNHVDIVRRQQGTVVTEFDDKSVTWVGTHGADPTDYSESASLIEQGRGGLHVLLSNLITRCILLGELPDFFNRRDSSDSFGKTLVLPG